MAKHMKACRKCGIVKEPSEFPPNRKMRDGLHSWCRQCANAATQAWRDKVRDEFNAARREAYNADRPPLTCVECGESFEAQRGAMFCSKRCKSKRYQRVNREKYLAAQRRKDARRRARKRSGRENLTAKGSGRTLSEKGGGGS